MASQSAETRGAWIFEKMSNIYGGRFLDLWRDVDLASVQAEWTIAMHGMSRNSLQLGVAGLYRTRNPPTLPEFLALCEPQPAMYRTHSMLTDERHTAPAEARAHLAEIAAMAIAITRAHPVHGRGIEWAHRLLARAAGCECISVHQIGFAKEAIENWERSNGTSKAQGVATPCREPGCDDEDMTNTPEG